MNIKERTVTPVPSPTAEVLRCLADATRQHIMQVLLAEELNVTQLVAVVGQPQPTVSRHLKALRDCALVRDRRMGNSVVYQAVSSAGKNGDDLVGVLVEWLRGQPLPGPLQKRLERVLRDRCADSVAFFDRLGQKWDELRTAAFGEAPAVEAMVGLLPREWTVADLGTGTGYMLPILGAHFAHVIGIEPSATMIECARRRVAHPSASHVEVLQGDFARLPVPDAACDLAIACLVLHHVPKPEEALAEAQRIVRPGGRLLIVEQESHEDQRFYDEMQDLWWGFDRRELSEKVSAAGFENIILRNLVTPESAPRQLEAPRLFCITAIRGNGNTVQTHEE